MDDEPKPAKGEQVASQKKLAARSRSGTQHASAWIKDVDAYADITGNEAWREEVLDLMSAVLLAWKRGTDK